jgi:PKD repeat protein
MKKAIHAVSGFLLSVCFLSVFTFSFPSASAAATPVADFYGTPTTWDAPANVSFTDNSSPDTVSWSWDFGDGTQSEVKNPTHQYDKPGTYAVTLTARSASGASTKTRQSYITVEEHVPVGDEFLVNVDETAHRKFGLYYPVTYKFRLPPGTQNLKAQYRYWEGPWRTLSEKKSTDLFNGIDAVRFDYTNQVAYLSVRLNRSSDNLYLRVVDIAGQPVPVEFDAIPRYYDDRRAAVTVTLDDWATFADAAFRNAAGFLAAAGIYYSVGIITDDAPWSSIQDIVNKNADLIEVASHGSYHSCGYLYGYQTELIESRDVIRSNLTFPAHPYIPLFIEPCAVSDPILPSWVTAGDYLLTRGASLSPTFVPWDETQQRYGRAPITFGDSGRADNANLLLDTNAAFDEAVAAGGIYHLADHPNDGHWQNNSYLVQHLDYIKGKTNLWYAPFGQLYQYHFLQEGRGNLSVRHLQPSTLIANFSATPLVGTPPLAVAFSDTSSGEITGWQWNFGDSAGSALQNPTHVYSSAGTYSVSLAVTGAAQNDTRTQSNYVTVHVSAPAVTISSPVNRASFGAPAAIPIAATATTTGSGAGVTRVEFYAGTELIGTATTSPYIFTWSNVAAGSYTLTAKVIDSVGSSATSAPVSVSVAASGLPAPWATLDVGNVMIAGNASFANGSYTVQGAGNDIYGAVDAFRYVYRQLAGDGEIVARLVSQQNTNGFAKAGVMIRESLADNAAEAMMVVTPSNGVRFGRRTATGGTTAFSGLSNVAAPYWVKLVRSGSTLSGYVSANGVEWQSAGSSSIPMGSRAYIGLAVSSHDITKLCSATFDSVTVKESSAPPTVSITGPVDGAGFSAPAAIPISATAVAGSGAVVNRVEFYAGSTLVGTATAAPFSVTWSNVAAGSYSLTATVIDSLGGIATSPSVLLKVAESPSPSVSIKAPADGASYQAPATIALSAAALPGSGATVSKVEFFAGANLVGAATAAPFEARWSDVAVGSYSLTAKVTDSLGGVATSPPVLVTVTATVTPSVSMTAPVGGASYYAPATIALAATATPATGATVSKVEFYAGATVVASAAGAPFTATWSDVGAGSYSLTAKVTDSLGGTATSGAVAVTVLAKVPPVVSITAPVGGAYAPGNITLSATASPGSGATVSRVEFYAGTTFLGSATAAPFTVIWSNVPAGRYSLTARVIDSLGSSATSAPVSISVDNTGLPAPWATQDVGKVVMAGAASFAGGTVSVQGAGSDIYGGADQFRYVYQQLNGDGQIVARVVSQQNTNDFAKAGVMIRESLADNSSDAMMLLTPVNGARFGRRATTGATTDFTPLAKVAAPYWVKLVRSGSKFSGYVSQNGTDWQPAGSGSVTMAATVYIGLAVTSHDAAKLSLATFDSVSLSGASTVSSVSITAPASGTSFSAPATVAIGATASAGSGATVSRVEFYAGATLIGSANAAPYGFTWSDVPAGSYSLTARAIDSLGSSATSVPVLISVDSTGLPAPWGTQDVGSVGLKGTANFAAGTFSVEGAGWDIYGSADGFRYLYRQLDGDGEIVARVASLQNTNGYAKAGVMIRESLADNASDAMMVLTALNGARFGRRTTTGATTDFTPLANVAAPYWVKLVRSGSKFTGSVSKNGTDWQQVGSGSVSMANSVYIGLAVTSHDAGKLCLAMFDGVSGVSSPPTVKLTAPAEGASFYAPATVAMTATVTAGSGATVSKVDFYAGATLVGTATTAPYSVNWSNVAVGTYSLTAKVTDSLGATATSSPVSIGVIASTPPTASITAPAEGASFYAPASVAMTATVTAGSGASVSKVDFYAGATLVGTATTAPYSVNWSNVAVGTYSLTAKVTDSLGATATSSPVSIGVIASTPPTASITAPAEGASFYAPATVAVTASVTAGSGATVSKVDFYAGATLVGTATSAPYSFTWSDVAVGTYSVTAKVTDSLGGMATSTAVSIVVVATTPPTASITAPAEGASFYAPATVAVTASVTAGSGATVSKVDFYAGATLVGTATSAPYSVTWSNVAVGTYPLTAKVTDSLGATATSSPVSINVVASTPPTASITAPAEGASFYAPATVAVTASVTAGSGATVSKVDFYAGATLVGTATTAPFSFTWSNVADGTYLLTAKVTDSLGATATSSPVSIGVIASTPPTASITAPAEGASFYAPATVAMTATVTAGTGAAVSKVEFYADATLVGTATAAPYAVSWSDVAEGSYSLTAKVTDSLGATATSSSVVVSVVASIPPAVSITAPAEGASFYAPASIEVAATAKPGRAPVSKVDFYAGATLIGTATAAPFSVTWSDVAVGTYSLTATVTDTLGGTAVSTPVAFTVVATVPPAVSITVPGDAASYYAPATIEIAATAIPGSGASITKVEYYAGSTLVGTATTDPFSFTWRDVAIGTYALTAKVTDSLGGTATSNPVAIGVVATIPPAVSLTAPFNEASFYAPATVEVAATATPGSGATVSKVDFYAGATLIGTAINEPFTVTWREVAAGSYSLTAKVTDSLGGTATSPPVQITVVPTVPPAVSLTAPVNEGSFYAPATVEVAATATPGSGATVSKVEFYEGATLVGTATTEPFTLTWREVAVGTYSLTAKVTDSLGGMATSNPVAIGVVATIPPAVTLTAPVSEASYYAPATVEVAATATPGSGATVSKVEFYAGATLVGTATTEPFTLTWGEVGVGTYSLTAKVTDSLGGMATSPPVQIIVVPTAPPAVK